MTSYSTRSVSEVQAHIPTAMNDECATKTGRGRGGDPCLMDIEQLKEQCLKGTATETGSQRQSRHKLHEIAIFKFKNIFLPL